MVIEREDARLPQPSGAAPPDAPGDDRHFLAGGGEMGERIRSKDWAQTPLGPIETWPQSLRTIVRIMLTSQQPIWIGWGPELIKLYNDPYKAIVGGKHPQALGQPASVVWRDIWRDIAPMLARVMEKNEGTYVESQLLIMERYGYPEETYYTFSYNPVPSEQGGVGGMICTNTDDTQRVIGERQLALLRALAADTADARTVPEVCARAATSLAQNPRDLPFAAIYLVDAVQRHAALAGTTNIARGHAAIPERVALDANAPWPFADALATGQPAVVPDAAASFGDLPTGAWDRPPHQAVVVPIAQSGHAGASGFLLVGLNPYRLFDEGYRGFIALVAGQIASSIANAQAYEEERKRAEALAEIDRAKTTFFSNVSHEFRTPLTLMLGPIEDALREPDTIPVNRERMDVAHRNALRLLRLVNSLLDFSRIEAGRVQASYEPTDLAAYTADLASGFRSAIERAGMALIVDCPPLPEPVYVDREIWEKVVLNLLSNAFKYTLHGTITVSLREANGTAVLSVADTGVGIPAHELPHMFERFHRVAGTEGRTHEGTGIGLSLVHELVRLHGGEIAVTSTLGEGSTFTVTIPLGTSHLPAERISAARTQASTAIGAHAYVEEALRWLPGHESVTDIISDLPPPSPLAGEQTRAGRNGDRPARIVLADDNADMREYVGRLLRQRYDVEAVGDGEAALAAVRREPPDLVLTDVMMPRLDGFGLLGALRADAGTREIPVIMLSARAGEESRIEGMEAGADDYLVKPFSARELLARVGAHLDMAETRRQARQASEDERRRLYALFMQAPAIIAVLRGPRHVFELANPLCMRMVGTQRDLIGKGVREALPELEYQGFIALLDSVYRSGEPYIGNETPVLLDRGGDGELEWVYFNFVYLPYKDAAGQTQGILVHAVDVTNQVRARQRVEEQNRVLEMITQGAPLADALAFLVRSIEQQSANGVKGSVLLLDRGGTHLRHGAAPSLPDAYNAAIDGIAIGPTVGSCGTAAYTKAPVVVADIATDPLWADFRDLASAHGLRACWSTPIFAADGDVLGTFAMYYGEPRTPSEEDEQRIAFATRTAALAIERYRAEEMRARLAAIVESSDDAIIGKDLNGIIMTWNRGAERIFGYTAPEVIGKPVTILIPPDRQDEEPAILERIRAGEGIDHIETVRRRKDGTLLDVSLTISPIIDNQGAVVGASKIARDITERRALERQKDAFIGIAAHELRTPVTSIKGYAQLLARRLRGTGDESTTAMLEKLDTQIDKLTGLIEDLLDVTRIESGKLLFRPASFEINTLIAEIAEEIQRTAARHTIVRELGAPVTIVADRDRIGQVLTNLLTNAIKYSPHADRVIIRAARDADNICISVQDFGIGIPKAQQARVFERFFRVDGDNRAGYSGLGLGLYIAAEFVKRHGGTIWANGDEGKGTTMTFSLPIAGIAVASGPEPGTE
jgi:PAS domain S-box-containing protein